MNQSDDTIRLLLTGGGTGGHLFPAIAAAEKFQKLWPGTEVLFVGTKRKIDTKTLTSYGFASRSIMCYGLKGKSVVELLKAVLVLPLSLLQAVRIILRFKPEVILGVGGYVTGPVVLAGKILGIPTVIHEQNSIPGLANRKLGNVATRICLSLPGSDRFFPQEKVCFTGNPVRESILALKEHGTAPAVGVKTLLILGGSQGAHAVNRLVSEAICSLSQGDKEVIRVIHQTGERDEHKIKILYEKHGVEAEVKSFFTAMHDVYGKADLIVSRAGATSLAEISVLEKPVILIPYPYAADNHQEKNGEMYVQAGGALLFTEEDLTCTKLGETITHLLSDEDKLVKMGKAMKILSYPDAAERIVNCCLKEIKRYRNR